MNTVPAAVRIDVCHLYFLSSYWWAIQIRRASAENLYQIQACHVHSTKKIREPAHWYLNIPVRSSSVMPILLSSSFNQRAMSGRWAHLSPVLFNLRSTLCPISSNNSLAQSSMCRGRLESPQLGSAPVRTLTLVRLLLYITLLVDFGEIRPWDATDVQNLAWILPLSFFLGIYVTDKLTLKSM